MQSLLVMPFCLIERIHYLRWISIVSVFLVIEALVIVFFHFSREVYRHATYDVNPPNLGQIEAFRWSTSIFVSVPITAVCFVFRMSSVANRCTSMRKCQSARH
jgi:amino acid permease